MVRVNQTASVVFFSARGLPVSKRWLWARGLGDEGVKQRDSACIFILYPSILSPLE